MYALVRDNVIIEKRNVLQGVFEGITNIETMDDAALKEIGWLPIVESAPLNMYGHQEFTTEYTITENAVIANYIVINKPVSAIREVIKIKIKNSFQQAFSKGYICPSVNIKMDCTPNDHNNMITLLEKFRREQVKVDNLPEEYKADAQAQLDVAKANITIRDFNNDYHTLNISDIDKIVGDFIDYGLYLYQHKWDLENEINELENIDAIMSVQW